MHCPKCGQQQVSEETRFCSRCGLLLTEIEKIVASDGVAPGSRKKNTSPRLRGLKQGLFLLLTSLLIVPIATMITIATRAEPFVLIGLTCLIVAGGILRMAYAALFESGESDSSGPQFTEPGTSKRFLRKDKQASELNAMPANTAAAPVYSAPEQGKWRDTNDLNDNPPSVTDNTTKLLHQENEN